MNEPIDQCRIRGRIDARAKMKHLRGGCRRVLGRLGRRAGRRDAAADGIVDDDFTADPAALADLDVPKTNARVLRLEHAAEFAIAEFLAGFAGKKPEERQPDQGTEDDDGRRRQQRSIFAPFLHSNLLGTFPPTCRSSLYRTAAAKATK